MIIDDPRVLQFPSDAPSPELGVAFPTYLVDVERMVYDFVFDSAQLNVADGLPALSFYADRARSASEDLRVPVGVGWPAYPGQVPAIGIAAGTESEDHQHDVVQGGFAGNVIAYVADDGGQPTGVVAGTADYFSEPLYSPIIIQLIHENRNERDRLHNELRRLLFPLRAYLLGRSSLIKKVTLDAEKTEADAGPPIVEQPITVYISLFTIHVYSEMLEPRRITDSDDIIARIDVDVVPADRAS